MFDSFVKAVYCSLQHLKLEFYKIELKTRNKSRMFAIFGIDSVWNETTAERYCSGTGSEIHACTNTPTPCWLFWTRYPEKKPRQFVITSTYNEDVTAWIFCVHLLISLPLRSSNTPRMVVRPRNEGSQSPVHLQSVSTTQQTLDVTKKCDIAYLNKYEWEHSSS